MKKISRFEPMAFDARSRGTIHSVTVEFKKLEAIVEAVIVDPKAKAFALSNLEAAFMCIGRAVKNDQIARTKGEENE